MLEFEEFLSKIVDSAVEIVQDFVDAVISQVETDEPTVDEVRDNWHAEYKRLEEENAELKRKLELLENWLDNLNGIIQKIREAYTTLGAALGEAK